MDSFGQATADVYDAEPRGDEASTVRFLKNLADVGGGDSGAGAAAALELAIGTGRIALPLAAQGLRVDSIDLSPAMVAKLRAKPGGEDLSVTIGDFAGVPVEGTYPLIYIVFNTLFNLLTQKEQVRCFQNVASHLTEEGVFVVEAFVPSYLYRLRDDQYVDAEQIGVSHVRFDVGRHDPVAQRLDESHVELSPQGLRFFPVVALRLAERARSNGADRRPAPARALGWLGKGAFYGHQPQPRLRLWSLRCRFA